MELNINKETVELLTGQGFYPDTMFSALAALVALHKGDTELMDAMDDSNRSKRMVIVYYDLVRKGFWKESQYEMLFEETDKGKSFVELLINAKPAKVVPIKVDTVSPWFGEWFSLWPKGVRTMGKLVRSDEKGCLKKMQAFVKNNPEYPSETIIAATQKYLEIKERDNWQGVRSASNFIELKGSSDLAAECADYTDEVGTEINSSPSNYFI